MHPKWVGVWRAGVAALLATACGTAAAGALPVADCPGSAEVSDAVYLVGDAGSPELPDAGSRLVDPVLRSLQRDVLASIGELGLDRVTVVYLGDNVAPEGLSGEPGAARERGLRTLAALRAAAEPARTLFVAGYQDWRRGAPGGAARVRAQAATVAGLEPRVRMVPVGGCLGPAAVDIGDWLRITAVDPLAAAGGGSGGCPGDAGSLEEAIASALVPVPRRHRVLAWHYPLISSARLARRVGLRQHLFPLTDAVPFAFVPLPLVGSIYALARSGPDPLEAPESAAYAAAVALLERRAEATPPLLVASGHGHGLQLHRNAGSFYAVSGAVSPARVARLELEARDTQILAEAHGGYLRLDAHADGAVGISLRLLRGRLRAEDGESWCLAEGPPPDA